MCIVNRHYANFCALGLLLGATGAWAAPETRLIIQWRDEPTSAGEASAEIQRLSGKAGRRMRALQALGGRMQVLQLPEETSPTQVDSVLEALRTDPRIALAAPAQRMRAHAYAPNDPLFSGQWYLKSAEAAATRTENAWDITRGGASATASTVVVAVLDTGVRFDHPDLRRAAEGGKLLPGYDFISGDSNGTFLTAIDGNGWDADASDPGDAISADELSRPPFQGNGCGVDGSNTTPTNSTWHGTRVSGMIAADSDNFTGITGAAFHVKILPVRVLGKCGGFDTDVIAGMYWAAGIPIPPALMSATPPVNPHPAQIINMSLGGAGTCSPQYAEAVRALAERGVLVVSSSGNSGKAAENPGNCPGALSVAGVRHIGTKVGYSNLGPEVGIAAPAGNCVNITPGSPCLFSLHTTTNLSTTTPGAHGYTDAFRANTGTSFAAPQVSGVAALMKAVNPRLTPVLLVERLRATARSFPSTSDSTGVPNCQRPSVVATQNSECICNTEVCGAGLLDAASAVNAALQPAVLAQVTGTVGPGRVLTLDGTQSSAALGRSIASIAWTVLSATGGATSPTINNASLATATVESPTSGQYTLQLTVTDNLGARSSAQLSITAANNGGGTGSNSPPPVTGNTGGGGGFSILSILLLLGLHFSVSLQGNAALRRRI